MRKRKTKDNQSKTPPRKKKKSSKESESEDSEAMEEIDESQLSNRDKTGRSLHHFFATHGLDGADENILNEPRSHRPKLFYF